MIDYNLLPTEGPGREDMLELYSWDFEKAWKEQEEWPEISTQRGPFFRWLGAQELKEIYEIYKEKKDPALIIEGLYVCSLNSLPLPRWCEFGFLKAYRTIRHYKAKSWDQVFGKPHKKGKQLYAAAQQRGKGLKIYNRITGIKKKDPSIPIDNSLFEDVGEEFGCCRTLAADYYYYWKNRISRHGLE